MKLVLGRYFSDPSVTAVLDPLANNVRAHRFMNDWVFISLNAAVSVTTTVWFTALTAATGITRTLIEPRGRCKILFRSLPRKYDGNESNSTERHRRLYCALPR